MLKHDFLDKNNPSKTSAAVLSAEFIKDNNGWT